MNMNIFRSEPLILKPQSGTEIIHFSLLTIQ